MTVFLRLLAEDDKAAAMLALCSRQRAEGSEPRPQVFEVAPQSFDAVPGKPFAYWVSDAVRSAFVALPPFEGERRAARQGGVNGDDFRWLRLWFEQVGSPPPQCSAVPIAKGGSYSPFYTDVHLLARWDIGRKTFFSFDGLPHRPSLRPASFDFYFRPGLTWPLRTNGLSFRVMPRGCVFGHKGPAAFVADDKPEDLLALCSLLNSRVFKYLVQLQLARTELAQSYEVGLIQQTPVPDVSVVDRDRLAGLARRGWSLTWTLDTVNETSHAFLLPAALRKRVGSCGGAELNGINNGRVVQDQGISVPFVSSVVNYDPPSIEAELACIQAEIDAIAFDLYGFSEADRSAALSSDELTTEDTENTEEEEGEKLSVPSVSSLVNLPPLLSWAVGVALGRFDWRLATGGREPPPEPDPFDPLPAKSPGMLPDGAEPFHAHAGILVDDLGHRHDLPRLVESVLERVDVPVPPGVRKWLQRDFFKEHLQQYSKSRRKAPIYWPLATTSSSYTLWVYYPSLTSQTRYAAVNDFVEPKLKSVSQSAQTLRAMTGRSSAEERELERLQNLELELTDLRDTLLTIAPDYKPDHDDGVQITAAPLWPLFRHKPWQKVLKETWQKLEKGDYDWAHLAMSYWPDRVRDKCRTDKSLAIAHGLEDLYQEPPEQGRKTRGRKK